MLLSLDQFVFGLTTASFHELQRRTSWKHASTSRVGARNARQYTGQGDDSITLTGLIAPNQLGTLASIDKLRAMADTGDAHVLVDGTGRVYGAFIIQGITEGQTYHMQDGTPRRVEFSIELEHVDDSDIQKQTQASNEESR